MAKFDITWMIPSARPSPLKTLQSLSSKRPCLLVSDPRYFEDHKQWVKKNKIKAEVMKGKQGLVGQIAFLYMEASKRGTWCFRTDDDLESSHYLTKQNRGDIPLDEVIDLCEEAAVNLSAGLIGLGGSNRFFLNSDSKSYGKAKGVLLGQSQLFRPSKDPFAEGLLDPDPRVRVAEDIYRTIAHDVIDGVVGKLKGIGMNWNKAIQNSVNEVDENDRMVTFKLIDKNFMGKAQLDWRTMSDDPYHPHIRWRIIR